MSETPQTKIGAFVGEYRFLSNFFLTPVGFRGLTFPSSEHAYQAAKCADPREAQVFTNPHLPLAKAKRIGQDVKAIPNWDAIKIGVMRDVLACKFASGSALAQKLIDTGNAELVEGNYWKDDFWGVRFDNNVGENHLGKLLMERRATLNTPTIQQSPMATRQPEDQWDVNILRIDGTEYTGPVEGLVYVEVHDPEARQFMIAQALSLGWRLNVGTVFNFSAQLRQVEVESLDDVASQEGVNVGEKQWVTLTVTKEDLEGARWLLATDPRFKMYPGNISMLIRNKA